MIPQVLLSSRYQRISDLVINADIYDISIAMASESFHKIISELIDNAFKFSEQGSIVEISAEITDGKLIIHIKDNGRGMTNKVKRNIFIPGFLTKKRGWGLG